VGVQAARLGGKHAYYHGESRGGIPFGGAAGPI
jgi:hypothetical protein